jgi:hypothetical protein
LTGTIQKNEYGPPVNSPEAPVTATALALRYVLALSAFFVLMGVLWVVGIEAIYGHPTPFYAVWMPVFEASWIGAARHAAVIAVVAIFGLVLARALRGVELSAPLSLTLRRRLLAGLIVFGVVLPCAVAMLRGGTEGISQAYARATYEYAGDIGKARSISDLFTRYLELRPYLSMHSKVHPPGPIAFLWLLSYLVGQDPLPLSIATIIVAAFGVVPLFYWARDLLGEQAALIAALLYTCVPSVVLFNATSADALFPPVTLSCLLCFDRALRAPRLPHTLAYAAVAGLLYFVMTILKFSLVGMGAYFAFAGLLLFAARGTRRHVVLTAGAMCATFLLAHLALRATTHFDIVAVFHAAKEQFDTDQYHLDQHTPRYPGWVYRFLNPMCWFYFVGIPVALLFWRRLRHPDPATRGLFLVFALTALALNLLYLARGEGERSALYLYPFLVLPAAGLLRDYCQSAASRAPLYATLIFLVFQVWLTESLFYTYW